MNNHPNAPAADTDHRIASLVGQLRAVEQELQELTGGRLDAITEGNGSPSLLREALEKLRPQEAAQRQAAKMQMAILNALPAHIALLDTEGVILAVNEAWRRFASANVLQSNEFFVGQNYIGVCESARGECAEESHAAAAGIRQVLRGEAKEFALEYPCHSPAEERWFRLMVTPLSEHQMAGAVVMHVNVTTRRQTEKILRENQQRLEIEARRLNESQMVASIGSWETDLATLDVVWTEQTHRIFETAPGTFTPSHQEFLKRVHPDDRVAVDAAFARSRGVTGPFAIEHRLLMPDGRIKFIEERWRTFNDEADRPARALGTCQDITERKLAAESLAESQALLRIAGQTARLGGWSIEVPSHQLRWSDEICMIHDVPPGETPTLEEALQFYAPEYRDEVARHVKHCADEGRPFDFELEIITAKQRRIWVRAIGEAVRDDKGQIRRIQGAFQDISQQKAAEAAAHSAGTRLIETLESITDGFFTLDREWRFTYVNAESERLLNCQRSSLLGHTVWEAYPPVIGSVFEREYRRAVAEKCTITFEEHYPPFDMWIEVKAYPSAEGLAIYFRDVSERHRTLAALRTSESKFRQLAESNVLGIITWNAEGQISDANDAFLQMFGYTREELQTGQIQWRTMTPTEHQPLDERALAEIATTGRCTPFEKEYFHKGGHRVAIMVGAAALDGAKDRGICYVVDISPLKQAEAKVRASEGSLVQAQRIARIGNWDWNIVTNDLYWSAQVFELFGILPDEFGCNYEAFLQGVHPEDRKLVHQAVQDAVAGNAPYNIDHRVLWPDGTVRVMHEQGEVTRDSAGRALKMTGTVQDITEGKLAAEAVQASELRFRGLFDQASVGMYIYATDGRFLRANQRFCDIVGYSAEEVLPLDCEGMTHPDDRGREAATISQLLAGEIQTAAWEKRYLHKSGRAVWCHLTLSQLPPAAGQSREFVGVVVDITERRRAEEALRASEERFRLMIEGSEQVLFYTHDREHRFEYLSPSTLAVLGYEPAELVGQPCDVLVIQDDPGNDNIHELTDKALQDGKPCEPYLAMVRHKDGRRLVLEILESPILNDGHIVGIQGFARDITEREAARSAVAASEREFRNLAEAMPQIVWITRPDGWTTYFNQHWIDYTGLSLEESLGHGWNSPFHPDDKQRAWDAWQAATTNGHTYALECRLRRADGAYRWWLIRGEPQRDTVGEVIKWFGTCTDIHDLKVAEMEITRTNRALKMLSGCNEALIHADDETTLLRDVCQLAVDTGGYRMAWVGYAMDDEKRTIQPVAHAGEENGYLAEINLNWDAQSPSGKGPGGKTIRGGQAVVCADMEQDPNFHWLGAAQQRGYRAVICLPLRDKERTFGLLGLYSATVNVTNAEEQRLLQEMADDLAFGILNLRLRIEQRRTQESVLAMARGISTSTGDEFFEKLTFSMVEALGAHAGFIAKLDEGSPSFSTLCAVVDGKLETGFDGILAGTSCDPGRRDALWVVPKDVQQCCPEARRLKELGIQAYVGSELSGADGSPCGLMFVLFREPLAQHEFISSTLKIFAARASGELARQKTDAQLREQATLLDKAQDAILVRDLDHQILYWNRSAERLYGWSAAEALGRDARQLIYQDIRMLDAPIQKLLKEGEWVGEVQQITKDGRQLNVEAHWSLVRDETGRPKSILAINTDVTERKKIEAQYLRSQRMESIGTLAGGIAHDLNNVLAPIMMSIELLKMQEKNPRRLSILSTIEGSSKRGADMVRQVLSFARGVEGHQLEVQAGHLIAEIQKIAQDTFLKNIEVRSSIPADLWVVQGDPTQLHQVLLNLCVNARDAMPNGGTLSVAADNLMLDEQYAGMNIEARPGPYVRIVVEDTGTGMPPDVLERIFEPFFTTKELGKGTGLGLSTTIAIIKSHGGFVRVYSEVGMGTRFHVYLPACTQTEAQEGDAAPAELPRGSGELVLVIDDEAAVRQITRQTLEAFGYRVVLASDGVEATSIYASRRQEIAVVLTDMMMPLMDGPTTIQVLLRMNPQLRIIAASGLNANGMVAKAASAGVTHFIPKPYTADTLLKTLRALLEQPRELLPTNTEVESLLQT